MALPEHLIEDRSISEFRLVIDGEYTSRDAAALFDAVATLYKIIAELSGRTLDRAVSDEEQSLLGRGNELLPRASLFVVRMNYNSPGGIDFAGLGKLAEQLRLLLEGIVDRVVQRQDREIDRQRRRLENEALAAQVYGEWLEMIARNKDFFDGTPIGREERIRSSAISNLLRLANLIEQGKITQVEKTSSE